MLIHKSFPGGNIQINRIQCDDVYLEQEFRDTEGWWFYWAFCVEGAQGKTVTFHFENQGVLGYWGPCVSRDDSEYEWLGADSKLDDQTFQMKFYGLGTHEIRKFLCWRRAIMPVKVLHHMCFRASVII